MFKHFNDIKLLVKCGEKRETISISTPPLWTTAQCVTKPIFGHWCCVDVGKEDINMQRIDLCCLKYPAWSPELAFSCCHCIIRYTKPALFNNCMFFWVLFDKQESKLFPTWINNERPHEVQNENTFPFPNLNGCSVEFLGWIANFVPRFITDTISYPCRIYVHFCFLKWF